MTSEAVFEGLEGVVVTKTALSHVDGERGRLIVAGHDIENFAGAVTFENAAFELFSLAGLPCSDLAASVAEGRSETFSLARNFAPALASSDPMSALRAAVDLLPESFADPKRPGLLMGALASILALHANGAAQRAPSDRPQAADLLRMIAHDDSEISAARARALDTYLVTVMDHGMNASTFAARVVASTASDVISAISAGLGALKGPLHGGAPGPVLDMLDAIGTPENAENWLENELLAKRRIMGMGHRIYRVRDPRAAVLEAACERLEQSGVTSRRLALARAVERTARNVLAKRHPNRALDTNVEFYTAVLLDTIGLPRSHFTALFAVGRVAGWLAHVAEQRAKGRLIRPSSLYVGPDPH